MAGGAGPVKDLGVLGLQAVGLAGQGQIGQSPINSGQTDGRAVLFEGLVQLLGRDEPGGFAKGVLYGRLLRGIALCRHLRTRSTTRQIT